jgi:putative hydrolase of the HAD superfamily
VWYRDGLEVEYGFSDAAWASTPLDDGSQQVVDGGLRIVYERDGLLTKLLAQPPGLSAAAPQGSGQSVLTHLLFDFFGTLVHYSASRVDQGFHRSWGLVAEAGASLDYLGFLAAWDGLCEEFERRAQHSLEEYSMDMVCEAFLRRMLSAPPTTASITQFRDTYLSEWNAGVHDIPGVTSLLVDLSARFTLVLVTNTHSADLVDRHVTAMGIKPCFSAVVTSIEHGRRKPSRSIFNEALERSSGTAAQAVFVGDSYAADYLGATDAGIRALLIDPEHRFDVPAASRLRSVLDLRSMVDEQSGMAWSGRA